MNIAELQERGEKPGHDPWRETVAALSEHQERIAALEVERDAWREQFETVSREVKELAGAVALLRSAPAAGN